MKPLLMATLLLCACGAKRSPKAPQPLPEAFWLEVNPSTPALCIPFVGEPDADAVRIWTQSVGALEARDLVVAMQDMPPAGTHPALDALSAIHAILGGDAATAAVGLDAVVASHGADPCLLAASATALQLLGQVAEAEKRVTLARSIAPDDPEVALMYAFLAPVDRAADAFPALERGATERPERRAFAVALGIAAIASADAPRAIRWLEQAYQQGEEAIIPLLLDAYRADKRTDDYLRLASAIGLPLGDDGLLATADAPSASLRAMWGLGEGQALVATLETSQGALECTLMPEIAPLTVANFVGLATGTQPWTAPSGLPGQGALYRNLVFHRVIPDFMVQTGDPRADGTGGPGYRFPDEFDATTLFDRPGRLAMANSGPNSNGSQFFVTEAPAAHLDGRHTIFGQCTDTAVERVRTIARAEATTTLDAIRIEARAAAPQEE